MRGVFRLVRFLLILAIFAVGATWLVGAALPRTHVASRTAIFTVPPHTLFLVLITPEAYPEWRTGITQVERPDSDRFTEYGPDGPLAYRIIERDPPRRLVIAVDDPEQVFSGTWTYELAPDGTGGRATRLTITEHGEVPNPIFRAVARVMISPGATIEQFLRDLGRRYGQDSVEISR